MIWRTDKPTENVIVAKLTEDFCHIKDNYSLLYLTDKPYQHYCEYGEEIPYSAIEKWASLEEDKIPEGLEEAATEFANQDCVTFTSRKKGFVAGAKWDRAKMMEGAVDGRYMKADGKVFVESWLLDIDPDSVKAGDEVRLIVIPEKSEKVK